MIETFPRKYKTQEQRFLYVIFQRFGNFSKVARYLDLHRQTIYDIMEGKRKLSLEHAFILANRVGLPTALFSFATYVLIKQESVPTYEKLLEENRARFDKVDFKYITEGKEALTPLQIIQGIICK